jgi:hypothetical protein
MRAFDAAIGLAVAWANLRGVDAYARRLDAERWDHLRPIVAITFRGRAALAFVDPGSIVEPLPLTDTRVAFGIAMAKCGPWSPCAIRPQVHNGRSAHVHDIGEYVYVWSGDPTDPTVCVDLDPRRWGA